VPAFSGTTSAPPPLAGVVFPGTISRSAPATVTWTRGASTSVWIRVAAYDPVMPRYHILLCVPPSGDSGAYTIPAAALALIPSSETFAIAAIYRLNETFVSAGTYEVDIAVADAVFSSHIDVTP